MGGTHPVKRTKILGGGWTLLEWSINSGFSITMHTPGIRMRKVWCWIGYSETSSQNISVSWYQTIPWGGIQARGDAGQRVDYTYSA
ncbi:MAG: hypothetical protein ACYTBJ_12300 [Planctomycetota bacterium]|jgi:hypothetical protein